MLMPEINVNRTSKWADVFFSALSLLIRLATVLLSLIIRHPHPEHYPHPAYLS